MRSRARAASSSTAMYTRLAMAKVAGSRPVSSSTERTVLTCSTNFAVDDERRRDATTPADAHADLEAAAAQLIQRADALGQMDRAVRRRHIDRAPEPKVVVEGRREGQDLGRVRMGDASQDLFGDPRAGEAELLGARQVVA